MILCHSENVSNEIDKKSLLNASSAADNRIRKKDLTDIKNIDSYTPLQLSQWLAGVIDVSGKFSNAPTLGSRGTLSRLEVTVDELHSGTLRALQTKFGGDVEVHASLGKVSWLVQGRKELSVIIDAVNGYLLNPEVLDQLVTLPCFCNGSKAIKPSELPLKDSAWFLGAYYALGHCLYHHYSSRNLPIYRISVVVLCPNASVASHFERVFSVMLFPLSYDRLQAYVCSDFMGVSNFCLYAMSFPAFTNEGKRLYWIYKAGLYYSELKNPVKLLDKAKFKLLKRFKVALASVLFAGIKHYFPYKNNKNDQDT